MGIAILIAREREKERRLLAITSAVTRGGFGEKFSTDVIKR